MPFTLPPGRVAFFSDIVASMDQTGLGSIDLVVPVGQQAPLVFTRVYNSAGSTGTTGLTEDVVATTNDDRLSQSDGFMISPPDPGKTRFNLGIRTLASGATITAILSDGTTAATLATVTKTYLPNWFEQQAASDFFGVTVGGSDVIHVGFGAGSAILYGTTTDNTTNDPAIQFMRPDSWIAVNSRRSPTSVSFDGTPVEDPLITGSIPVAGSLTGAFGSQFRTQLQLFNPSPTPLSGMLNYHPSSTSSNSSDASLPFTLAPGKVTFFSDIVATMGQKGLGSIDVVVGNEPNLPIIVARVYNDGGSAGTTGLTEDLIAGPIKNLMYPGKTGFLITPPDPAKARFNMGVRTQRLGATLTATLTDGTTGATLATVTKTYPANWFEQPRATDFFGVPIGGNDVVQISVSAGSAIIYGSTTDNTTNDPSLQFMKAVIPGS